MERDRDNRLFPRTSKVGKCFNSSASFFPPRNESLARLLERVRVALGSATGLKLNRANQSLTKSD